MGDKAIGFGKVLAKVVMGLGYCGAGVLLVVFGLLWWCFFGFIEQCSDFDFSGQLFQVGAVLREVGHILLHFWLLEDLVDEIDNRWRRTP